MSSPRPQHLDVRRILDYLDQKLDAAGRREAEEHLARPCAECRERVRELGALLETMRQDRSADVPAWLHARAVDLFAPAVGAPQSRSLVERLAELVFDSLAAPVPAAARRSVGEARRLRFRLDDVGLDMELEPEGAATQSLAGRLDAAEPALWTLEVRCGAERRTARPDAAGTFALAGLPIAALDIHLDGPAGRFRLPTVAR